MRSFGSYRGVKIADIAEVNPRRPAQLLDLSPAHNVTFVPMAAVDEVSGRIIKPEVKRYDEVRKGFTYFGENDVLFAKITPCMQNGKSAIARNLCNKLGFGSTEFHVLRPSHEVLPEWLWYFVRQESFRSEAQYHFRGSAGQQRVPADFLGSHDIPLPTLSEQRRIVGRIKEMLALIDEIGTLHREAWSEARSLQLSFLGGIEHSLQCEGVTIGDVLLGTKNGRSIRSEGGPTNGHVLSLAAVRSLELNIQQCKAIYLDDVTADKYSIDVGDVFISRSNTHELVGLASIAVGAAPRGTIYPDLLIKLIPNTAFIDPWYLATALRFPSVRDLIRSYAKGTSQSMVKISGESVKRIAIPLPSLPEQVDIVTRVKGFAAIDAEMNYELAEDNTSILWDRILQKAFAGEL